MNSVSLAGRAVRSMSRQLIIPPLTHGFAQIFVRHAQGQSGPGMVSGDLALEADAEGMQQLRASPGQIS